MKEGAESEAPAAPARGRFGTPDPDTDLQLQSAIQILKGLSFNNRNAQ
jgi:hypothetical protein